MALKCHTQQLTASTPFPRYLRRADTAPSLATHRLLHYASRHSRGTRTISDAQTHRADLVRVPAAKSRLKTAIFAYKPLTVNSVR